MKNLVKFCLTVQVLCYSLLAQGEYEYRTLVVADGKVISGQLIGEYEEKWFWEPFAANSYVGLFEIKNDKPQIHFINTKEIKSEKIESKKQSQYNKFLKSKKLYLQRAPLRGWNYISTGNEGHHEQENMYGNFAWDIERVLNGRTFYSSGESVEHYNVWDSSIYSPIKGTVTELVNDMPDSIADPSHTVDLSQRGSGNYLLLHVAGSFYFSLIHLRKGSIPSHIKVGSKVSVGDFIGKVGNSGVTYVPHLHITMFYWSTELNRMMSVPTFMSNVETLTTPTGGAVTSCEVSPRHDQSIRTTGLTLGCSF